MSEIGLSMKKSQFLLDAMLIIYVAFLANAFWLRTAAAGKEKGMVTKNITNLKRHDFQNKITVSMANLLNFLKIHNEKDHAPNNNTNQSSNLFHEKYVSVNKNTTRKINGKQFTKLSTNKRKSKKVENRNKTIPNGTGMQTKKGSTNSGKTKLKKHRRMKKTKYERFKKHSRHRRKKSKQTYKLVTPRTNKQHLHKFRDLKHLRSTQRILKKERRRRPNYEEQENFYYEQPRYKEERSKEHGYHRTYPNRGFLSSYDYRIPSYPTMRYRILGQPFYNDYYDDYHSDERKDVIPMPMKPWLHRGLKREPLFGHASDKRSAYSPIVSAVQNMDQSENALFDSLLANHHDTTDVTQDLNNELSNFVEVPNNLESYNPTDTPSESYFDKDSTAEDLRDFTQNFYSGQKTTGRPTESQVDPSEIVDNEERLLSLVERVIAKQQKQKRPASESPTTKRREHSTVTIGDASEVFGTTTSVAGEKQSSLKELKEKLKSTETANDELDSVDGSIKNIAKGSTTSEANKTNIKNGGRIASAGKKPVAAAKFKIGPSGQRIIVENTPASQKFDDILLESLKSAKRHKNVVDSSKTTGKSEHHFSVAQEHADRNSLAKLKGQNEFLDDVTGTRKDNFDDNSNRVIMDLRPSKEREADADKYSTEGVPSNGNEFGWFNKGTNEGKGTSISGKVDKTLAGDKKETAEEPVPNESKNTTEAVSAATTPEKEASGGGNTTSPGERISEREAVTTAAPVVTVPPKSPPEDSLDWFGNPQPPKEPPEIESSTPPKEGNQPPGWRIKDYYLDDKNTSNWEQIRSAWTNKNGSEFVFNNKIGFNPNYNPKDVQHPQIHFLNGVTMPTLPTMAAPTDIPMQGFPQEEADEDEDLAPKPNPTAATTKTQQNQPYGLKYPWQWHNRKPMGNGGQDARLNYHGKAVKPFAMTRPLVITTSRPMVVTTRPKVVSTSDPSAYSPTKLDNNPDYIKAAENAQKQQDDKKKIENQNQNKTNSKNDTVIDQKENKEEKVKGKEKQDKEVESKGGENNIELKTEKVIESDNVLAESLKVLNESTTNKNSLDSSLVDKNAENKQVQESEISSNDVENKTSTSTKAPVELPILSEPTTKSAENYLPAVRPPSNASQKEGFVGPKPDTLSSNSYNEQSQNNESSTESLTSQDSASEQRKLSESAGVSENNESTTDMQWTYAANNASKNEPENEHQAAPQDTQTATTQAPLAQAGESNLIEQLSETTQDKTLAYEINHSEKQEGENADQRAKVTDSPLSRQAESVKQIRRIASKNQDAIQRQQVIKGNITNAEITGRIYETYSGTGSQISSNLPPITSESTGDNFTNNTGLENSKGTVSQITGSQEPSSPAIAVAKTVAWYPTKTTTTLSPPTTPKVTADHFPTPKPLFITQAKPAPTMKLPTTTMTTTKSKPSSLGKGDLQLVTPEVPKTSSNQTAYLVNYSYQTKPSPLYLAKEGAQTSNQFSETAAKSEEQQPSAGTVNSSEQYQNPSQPQNYTSAVTAIENKDVSAWVAPNNQMAATTKGPSFTLAANQNVAALNTPTSPLQSTTKQQPGTVKIGIQSPAGYESNIAPNKNTQSYFPTTYPSNIQGSQINQLQHNFTFPAMAPIYAWQASQGLQVPSASMRKEETISDSYLRQYGDRLNMDDLYWTDSSEEKEQICKQEKGTNEVVHIMCFGDSLTRGYYNKGKNHHPYTNKLQFLLNKLDTKKCYIVDNEGKDGELAFEEMPRRLESLFNEGNGRYNWAVILGGTNDIYNKKSKQRKSADEITKNIVSMHEIAWAHKARTVAVTIPEVFCETQETCQDAKQLRERVNYDVRLYANEHRDRVVLVDLADMLQRSNVGKDMMGQFFEGGLHLKPRGYERMAILIYEGLRRALS